MTQTANSGILVLDIETKPGKAYIWRMWDEVRNIEMLIEPAEILSWAAKWTDSDSLFFDSIHRNTKEGMMQNMWDLLDQARAVVGFNSNRFDLKHINAEFMMLGMGPPSPYKKVDLKAQIGKHAKFMSSKLDYIAQSLGIGHKLEHEGWRLWEACMAGDKKAWATMEEYNCQDVELTEDLFHRVRPWLPTIINKSIEEGFVCPDCGSDHLQSRGYRYTDTRMYRRYSCMSCGSWPTSTKGEPLQTAQLKKEPI